MFGKNIDIVIQNVWHHNWKVIVACPNACNLSWADSQVNRAKFPNIDKVYIHIISICPPFLDITKVPIKFWCHIRHLYKKYLTPQWESNCCMMPKVQAGHIAKGVLLHRSSFSKSTSVSIRSHLFNSLFDKTARTVTHLFFSKQIF